MPQNFAQRFLHLVEVSPLSGLKMRLRPNF